MSFRKKVELMWQRFHGNSWDLYKTDEKCELTRWAETLPRRSRCILYCTYYVTEEAIFGIPNCTDFDVQFKKLSGLWPRPLHWRETYHVLCTLKLVASTQETRRWDISVSMKDVWIGSTGDNSRHTGAETMARCLQLLALEATSRGRTAK